MGKLLHGYERIPLVSGGPGNWIFAKNWDATVSSHPNAIVMVSDGGGYARLTDVAGRAAAKADFRIAMLSGGTDLAYDEITDLMARQVEGPALNFTLAGGGSGWAQGDTFYVAGYIGTDRLEGTVLTVSTGAITAWRVTKPGVYGPSSTRAITHLTGSGTGATATIAADMAKSGVIRAYSLTGAGAKFFAGDTFTIGGGTAGAGVVDTPVGGDHTAVPVGFQPEATIAINSIDVTVPGIVVLGDKSGLANFPFRFSIEGSTSNNGGPYAIASATYNGTTQTVIKPVGAAVKATGTLTVQAGQPANLDTVTINGSVITFVSGTPSGAQVQIGGNAATTAASLRTYVNANTLSLGVTAGGSAGAVALTANAFGTAGNAIAIASSAAGVVRSAATLSGGAAGITFANDVTKGSIVVPPVIMVGSDVTTNFGTAGAVKITGSTNNNGAYSVAHVATGGGVTLIETVEDLIVEDSSGDLDVLMRSGGAVSTYHLTNFGTGYSTGTKALTASGGAVGTGATLNVTEVISPLT